MLLKDCNGCIYCQRMIGVGLGVRCRLEENQKYKKADDKLPNLPVIISHVPEGSHCHTKYENTLNKEGGNE